MRDYYNDPPECPEAPECCDREMECYDDGSSRCPLCGATVDPPRDIEPLEYEYIDRDKCRDCGGRHPTNADCCDEQDDGGDCPHGRDFMDCHACEHAADIAYDVARESRYFR